MRALERQADAAGVSYAAMMNAAGRAMASAVHGARQGRPARVVVLAGSGNNGGDGLVAAHYLHESGHAVQAYLSRREREGDANLDRIVSLGIPVLRSSQDPGFATLLEWLSSADVVIDALLGTGLVGPVRPDLQSLLSAIGGALGRRRTGEMPRPELSRLSDLRQPSNDSGRPLVVAVDVPSGLNSDTGEIDGCALAADVTVTFGYPKRGLVSLPGAGFVGDLVIADIGIPEDLARALTTEVATAAEVREMLPRRPRSAHKGTFGKAMIVAGSVNYVGAPRLAALGAYRVGAGLVTLAVPEAAYPIIASGLTEPTFLVLPDDGGVVSPDAVEVLTSALGGYDALLVGPGLGRERPTLTFLSALLGAGHAARGALGFVSSPEPPRTQAIPPLVLDADALNLLAQRRELLRALPPSTVLTPHAGEMARLRDCSVAEVDADRIECARASAVEWGCVVALKGAYTVVAEPAGRATVIPFANAALATAGTGDVLAGAITGLRAQGLAAYPASVCGAYVHALAGERWAQVHGACGMVASDLLALLPDALRDPGRQSAMRNDDKSRE
jgi:NAD(P)H-hydrate epimerase